MKPIAIIGMAGIFPGAADIAQYWRNIVAGVDAITDVPAQRWDSVFYDPKSNAVDRFYCKRGGFVDDYVDFDPLQFGVMPKAAQSADPDQLLSLRVGVDAMRDAGYSTRDSDSATRELSKEARERTGVIIGRGNYLSAGTLRLEQHVRHVQQTMNTLRDLLPDISDEQLAQVREQMQQQLDYYGPDVAVGMIPNLVASRLANRLDLHGPAYTVDAACASSLLAIEQACQLLNSGECNLMLAGGLHFTHDLTFWATFCQLGALSRSQQVKPFSRDADGILAGEGIGLVVLKRLDDAERDGDRIYAVIRGVGSASDGRGSSLLAPAVEGQLLALQRAWKNTQLDPQTIGLIEAHGTGTPTGDEAELETLRRFFGDVNNAPRTIDAPVIGSVKSMIGHTMPAAGVAGLIKAALSIYHGVLPPTLHCEQPHELLAKTRFRVIDKTETWPEKNRVAAVNAFGFGGINAHVVLSSHAAQPGSTENFIASSAEKLNDKVVLPHVVVIAAATQAELLDKLNREQWDNPSSAGVWRIAIIDPNEKRLDLAKKIVMAGKSWQGRSQIYFSCDTLLAKNNNHAGKVAFLFPGVDSAFSPRANDVASYFNLPLPPNCDESNAGEELNPADSLLKVVQGLSAFNLFTFAATQKLGIRADGMAGHSIGEWSAMSAAGMVASEQAESVLKHIDPSEVQFPDLVFLSAACVRALVDSVIGERADVVISHDNCPHQTILCGKREAIAQVEQALRSRQVLLQRLPIISGFHTPFFAKYLAPYRDFFLHTPLFEPAVPVWSATTAQPFPISMQEKQQLALDHLLQPVRFRSLIENMYADGFRAFIQLGTGSLSGFVQDTLKGKPHLAIDVNSAKQSGLAQLCHVSAALWVEGMQFNTELLGPEQSESKQSESKKIEPRQLRNTESRSSIKLRLGVPLLRLSEPLSFNSVLVDRSAAVVNSFAANVSDPIATLFRDTMTDIQQASAEILQLWQTRSKRSSNGPKLSRNTQARIIPLAPSQPATETTQREHRIAMRLDIDTNIADVIDHAFYPQRAGWSDLADRHPVIPLTMEVTLLRQAVENYLPGYVVTQIENVKAYNWLIVSKPIEIEIVLKPMQLFGDADGAKLEVSIEGYMTAQAIVAREYPAAPSKRDIAWKNPCATAIDAAALYRDNWMFHGPAYQGVTELISIADNGMRGRLRTPRGSGSLLDNMGQLAGYWVMEQPTDCLAMPIGVEQIKFYSSEPAVGSEFDCDIVIRDMDALTCITDQQLVSDSGDVVIEMLGWQTRRYQMDRAFWIHSKQLEKYIVSHRIDHDAVIFHDTYETAILRDYIARRYLNQIEMSEYDTLSPRRRRSWLNGRVAAKDAVRAYYWQRCGGFDFYPKEIRVENAANGQPVLFPHISNTLSDPLHLSIAHKDNVAVAAVSDVPVGIDIESIAERDQNFIDIAFTREEQALLPEINRAEWVARFWAAKEAVVKMFGTGFQGKPKQFCVESVDGEYICVAGARVVTLLQNNYVIAVTVREC
ncbi:MAG: beta-ketoacyl synthase N-terminal-like domain-containing protein [Spongiibacteraceae bacterium]